ncbi:MAG: NUDIX hydrolase [Aridibacter famidurans]|nr:NUDIX hydrolase [Aridibacter famidurans]
MLLEIARKIWKVLPYRARLFVVRTAQDKFTVSAVGLVVNSKGEVLVLDHFLRPGSSWGLPGGFIDPGEAPETAVKRELKEETGLDISDVSLLEVRTIKRHVEILFLAKGNGEPVLAGREIRAAQWFKAEDLPDDMYDHQRERIIRELERIAASGEAIR